MTNTDAPARITAAHLAPMGVCRLSWFAALRRLLPQTAPMATGLSPVGGRVRGGDRTGRAAGCRAVAGAGADAGRGCAGAAKGRLNGPPGQHQKPGGGDPLSR